ncbi:MAG: alkaline phosphatase D family protein [Actinomycetota bacterium]|nr:alkaline phosphatase D family protein [Actinomycetota bacterium]
MIQGNWDRREMSRRAFLTRAGMGAGALAVAASGFSEHPAWAKPFFKQEPFSLGVASGDPTPDGVVLWTRLAPEPLAEDGQGGMPLRKAPVRWEVATDEAFRDVVRKGNTHATPELAHSVHVEVKGLAPGREYFYRFKTGSEISPAGRTKTAPPFAGQTSALTFAFASCQNYENGYYAPYEHMARENLDLVVFLGDYIYEGDVVSPVGREHVGLEPRTLAQYRTRHAQYKGDENLRAAHAAFPWLVTWDDHEVDNNWAGEDQDPDAASREEFLARRAAAFQAYYEHLPLRAPQRPVGPDLLLYRRATFGNLAEFNVLDTRQYRSDQVSCNKANSDADGYCAAALDPGRTILGDAQERWLQGGLSASQAKWNVLANQVVFAERMEDNGVAGGGDSWDGYVADRRALVDLFAGAAGRAPSNPVVITGDIHNNRIFDLKEDFAEPSSRTVGTEFVGTSISTGGDAPRERNGGQWTTIYGDETGVNEHQKFYDTHRGYVRCTVTQQEWTADFRGIETTQTPTSPISTIASFVVEDGEPGAKRA